MADFGDLPSSILYLPSSIREKETAVAQTDPYRHAPAGSRGRSAGVWRLATGAFSAALALLAVFKAPTSLLWMLAIGVTEWGHALALAALAPLLPGWRRTWSGRIGAALGFVAALLALTPLLRALAAARDAPAQLTAAFGVAPPHAAPDAPPRPAPLVAVDLLRGIAMPPVRRRSLVYITRDAHELRLDLYQPQAAAEPAPGVLVVHGGAWQRGDSTQLAPLNRYLAARGYVVAAINYRLSPTHRFPAAHEDVLAALGYLKDHAAELGLDPRRLALLGRSAGGQLALLAAYTAGDPAIRGVVGFYAPTDMRYGYANPANPRVIDSRGVLEAFLGGNPELVAAAYDAASPVDFIGPATPPTLLIHGGRDELVSPRQSERLAERLAQAGRPHMVLRLPWATHGCDFNFSGPSGQISTYAIERFLAAVMADDRPPRMEDGGWTVV
jgi:acetyl esterase/lipase